MNDHSHRASPAVLAGPLVLLGLVLVLFAAEDLRENVRVELLPGGDVVVRVPDADPDSHYRIEASVNIVDWIPLATLPASEEPEYLDAAAPYYAQRYYRAVQLERSDDLLTGDHLVTDDGEVVIHPVNHASFVMQWNEKMIYNDPVGGSTLYRDFPPPDLVLVGHQHGDHFNAGTLTSVSDDDTVIVAPQSVFGQMSTALKEKTTVLANGESVDVIGLTVEAVPAYNDRHPKGRDNGYVVTIGGRRIYMGGDTEDVAEMRALEGIDVAFLPMNLPFTMSVEAAASAAREFQPSAVYPYHFRNQGGTYADLEDFKARVGTDRGVEVRIRDWY